MVNVLPTFLPPPLPFTSFRCCPLERSVGWSGGSTAFLVPKNLKLSFVAMTFNFLAWDGIHFWGTASSCFSGSALNLQVFFPRLSCSPWPTFGSSCKTWGCGPRRLRRSRQTQTETHLTPLASGASCSNWRGPVTLVISMSTYIFVFNEKEGEK